MAWNCLHRDMSTEVAASFGERFCVPGYRLGGPNCGTQNLRKQIDEPADPA